MSSSLAQQHYRKNVRGEVVTIEDRYLRLKEIVEKTGVSRAQVYRLMESLKFPPSFSISVGRVVWLEADIEEFMRLGAENFKKAYSKVLEAHYANAA